MTPAVAAVTAAAAAAVEGVARGEGTPGRGVDDTSGIGGREEGGGLYAGVFLASALTSSASLSRAGDKRSSTDPGPTGSIWPGPWARAIEEGAMLRAGSEDARAMADDVGAWLGTNAVGSWLLPKDSAAPVLV